MLIIFGFFILAASFLFLTRKYKIDNNIQIFIAALGAGKSTTITAMCKKDIKRKRNCAVNCDDIQLKGLMHYKTEDLGYDEIHGFNIYIDEGSLFFDNRRYMSDKEYRARSNEFVSWLRGIRHDNNNILLFTQSYDVDKKLRTLASSIWIGYRFCRVFTVWRRLKKSVALRDDALSADTQISDKLVFVPLIIPGAFKIVFLPFHVHQFDSYKSLKTYRKPLDLY